MLQVKAVYELTLGVTPELEAPATEDDESDLEESFPYQRIVISENTAAGLILAGGGNKSATLPRTLLDSDQVQEPEVIDLIEIAKSAALCNFEVKRKGNVIAVDSWHANIAST